MSQAWIVLASTDVDNYLVAAKADALRNAALRSGQADTIAAIISDVSKYVRLSVAACRSNRLDETPDSIPPSLKSTALDIIVARLHLRLEVALPQIRIDARDQAEKYLGLVRTCAQPIDDTPNPEDSATAQVSTGFQQAPCSTTRQATSRRLSGL